MPHRYQVPVYRAEKEAGLAEAIRSQSSVAYIVPLEPAGERPVDVAMDAAMRHALASRAGTPDADMDLYYLRDVLVTAGVTNKNRDAFDRVEVWAARHTPEDKPFNFEHRPLEIIGHITASRAVDEAMAEIDDGTAVEDLPAKFHIVNGSVLYMDLADDERRKVMEQTVAEIQRGEWYVSMECFFRGFDYGVVGPDGSQRVLARNEENAWLTKHLVQYGGTGVYTDEETGTEFSLSRVLRNITFSGKGLVRKPANPESVILNAAACFDPSPADSGYLSSRRMPTQQASEEPIQMAEASTAEQTLRDDNRRLEKQVEDLRHEIAGLKSKDTESALSGLRTQVQEKDSTISDLTTKVSNRDQTIADLNTQLETVKEASKSLQARAEKAEGELSAAAEELSKAKAAEVRRSRLATLKQKGAEAAVAEKLADRLASLDDEAFADTVESIAASWKKVTPKAKTDPVVAAIDRAKAEDDPAMATRTDDDGEREQSRASIEKFMGTTLGRAREGRTSVYAAANQE